MPNHLLRNLIATAITAILLPLPSQAFSPGGSAAFLEGDPTWGSIKGIAAASITAGKSHETITENALLEIYKEYGFGEDSGLKSLTASMKEAINNIKRANADIDEFNAHQSKYHCDADQLQQCSDLIRVEIDLSFKQLEANRIWAARSYLGSAFHTLQDFYSHSNWVEKHPEPNSFLGKLASLGNIANENAINKCRKTSFNLCDESNITTDFLTSGYFSDQDQTYRYQAATADKLGMCRHGGLFDKTQGTGGINKDSSTCFLGPISIGMITIPPVSISPHASKNSSAEEQAIKATVAALHDYKAKVNERQFKTLLGFGPSLGFAIDTTGSMGGEIAGVKADANRIINTLKDTINEPLQYVLSPFNDPSTGPITNTGNPDTFKSALASLSANGGGDCPELSMQGVYNAVAAMEGGGAVVVYTDASSKDAFKQADVYSLAAEKNIDLYWGLYGSCSPYDPAYFNLANRTGGQVFILPRGQTSGLSELANLLSRSNAADILSVAGQVITKATHTFPVDSSITRITVSVTSTGTSTITIKRPNGSIVKPSMLA